MRSSPPIKTQLPANRSGPHSPRASSPLQRIGNSQNYGTLNHNRNSFNETSTHTHYHQYCPCHMGHHASSGRRSSFSPTLASVASDDSSTAQGPPSPISAGIPPIEGDINQNSEHATRMRVAEASNTEASTSRDTITVEDRIVHPERTPVAWKSESGFPQASASQAHAGSVKRRSRFFTPFMNLGARLGRGSLNFLSPVTQPTNQEGLRLWTEVNINEVDDYVPPGLDKNFKTYMRSPHLPQANAIPVWNPIPIREVDIPRRKRIDVGDVGTFTRRGGFRVAFNILMSEKTNKLCGYDVPINFSQFLGKRSCIKDGLVIDLDNCGAIIPEPFGDCPDILSHGFKHDSCISSRELFTTGCEFSPEGSKDKRRGFILLPHGAKIYSFSSRATRELTGYLNESLDDWLEYLDRLWDRENAPPIILTSVWAARSFACATYTFHPPNTSALAQVWTAPKGDQIRWAYASEGFKTARAPQSDGYDENGRLKSQVEDQCFGIEGYVLKSRKKVSKLRSSLMTI